MGATPRTVVDLNLTWAEPRATKACARERAHARGCKELISLRTRLVRTHDRLRVRLPLWGFRILLWAWMLANLSLFTAHRGFPGEGTVACPLMAVRQGVEDWIDKFGLSESSPDGLFRHMCQNLKFWNIDFSEARRFKLEATQWQSQLHQFKRLCEANPIHHDGKALRSKANPSQWNGFAKQSQSNQNGLVLRSKANPSI